MPPATAGAPPIQPLVIVGGGLAGSLLALALRQHGVPLLLLDPEDAATASRWSYGAVPAWPLAPTPLARRAAQAPRHWRALERRHGPLGWRGVGLRLEQDPGPLARLSRLWPLPCFQVDPAVLMERLPAVLAAADVDIRCNRVTSLEPSQEAGGWRLALNDGATLGASQVVLAAGAGCRALLPTLPPRLRVSWAGVLELEHLPPGTSRSRLRLPRRFQRLGLERQAPNLKQDTWVVDGGLCPRGGGALLGQASLIPAAPTQGEPPPPGVGEQVLRQALAASPWSQPLAQLPAAYRQVPVAFCSDGLPQVGPIASCPGLWVFSGFSGGFSQVPVLAPLLAQALVGRGAEREQACNALAALGLPPL